MMTDMIIEAVIVAFCMGGAVGAIITLHLQYRSAHKSRMIEDDAHDGHGDLKRVEAKAHTRRLK